MSGNVINVPAARACLRKILSKGLSAQEDQWLSDKYEMLSHPTEKEDFFLTFSSVSRFMDSREIEVSETLREEADEICDHWSPYLWSTDRIAQVLFLLLATPEDEGDALAFIKEVFDTADMEEQVAIFSALPVLPHPAAFAGLASEGIRTNMVPVFDSVALDNPYPKDYFAEAAWNQLYLKAAFMGRPLYRIVGIDQRANEELARMILDYVHERWAAGREVSPEIWRPVKPFMSAGHREALEKLMQHPNEVQRAAAGLLLEHFSGSGPKAIDSGTAWTWEKIGAACENSTTEK